MVESVISFEKALEIRNSARERHHSFKKRNDETSIAQLKNADYDWGFWDAVITLMRNKDIKEINKKELGL